MTVVRKLRDYVSLTKPRINLVVLLTTFVGYWVTAEGIVVDPARLVMTLIGTALTVAGAGALNCYQEAEVDARMERTRGRPLPARRMNPRNALVFGGILGGLGLLVLVFGVNRLSAGLALAALLVYTPVYTLLKPLTSLSTLVGAVPGALPPVIGSAAVTGEIEVAALVLFAIMFVWQPPHFLALALYRRQDYERARLAMLPVEAPRQTSLRQITVYVTVLLPLTLLPGLLGMAGSGYLTGALILGGVFLAVSLAGHGLGEERIHGWARGLFAYSIVYLMALFGLLLWNVGP